MSEQITSTNPELDGQQSLIAVKGFLSQIWYHPLVDQRLRNFRQKFPDVLFNTLSNYQSRFGLEPDKYAVIPLGSFIWGVDEKSDIDFMLITSDSDTHQKMKEIMKLNFRLKRLRNTQFPESSIPHQDRVDALAMSSSALLTDIHDIRRISPVFLTPDDFIFGNKAVAAKVRQEVISQVKNRVFGNQDPDQIWCDSVSYVFQNYYQGWWAVDFTPKDAHFKKKLGNVEWFIRGRDPVLNLKRPYRIRKLLQERLEHSGNPDDVARIFVNHWTVANVPTFNTYHAAIEFCGGVISLPNSRFLNIAGIRQDYKPKTKESK
jgi:hypothetical protein